MRGKCSFHVMNDVSEYTCAQVWLGNMLSADEQNTPGGVSLSQGGGNTSKQCSPLGLRGYGKSAVIMST